MKSQLVVLLVSVAVFGCLGETAEANYRHADLIKSRVNTFNEFVGKVKLVELPNKQEKDVETHLENNQNVICKLFAKRLVQLLSSPINVAEIPITDNETMIINIKNLAVTGLENSILTMASPKTGFNLDNLTIAVPEILVEADHYHFENVDLGDIILNGDGKLKIVIKDFYFTTGGMVMQYSGKFTVTELKALEILAGSSTFELENLGNSTEEVSQHLNEVAAERFIATLNLITNDASLVIQLANGNCDASIPMSLICTALEDVINDIKDSISNL